MCASMGAVNCGADEKRDLRKRMGGKLALRGEDLKRGRVVDWTGSDLQQYWLIPANWPVVSLFCGGRRFLSNLCCTCGG